MGDHLELKKHSDREFVYPIKDWYFDVLAGLDFDHIRLPARWSDHCDDSFKIQDYFMQAVKKAVDDFLARGYKVVLNVHHFNGATQDPKAYQDQLFCLWRQIGEAFADYPDTLIFEVMNEPQHMVSAADWNDVQNKAVEVIRETNKTRKIMIGGVNWNGYDGLLQVEPPKDHNLIATFHYYHPMSFTHQGARWSPENTDLKGIKWMGTEDEVKAIKQHFQLVYDWSKAKGIEVNLGEFGAYQTGDMESRVRWTKCVRETAEEFGFSFTYWEFNYGFGICEREAPVLRKPLVDALLG